MYLICSIYDYLKEWLRYLAQFLRLHFKTSNQIRLENIALRSQLALYIERDEKENLPKPRPNPAFRQLWVFLSKHLDNWKEVIKRVKPDTVIKWHRTAFNSFWTKKSKKGEGQVFHHL